MDVQEGFGEPEKQILESIGEKPYFMVINKIDLLASPPAPNEPRKPSGLGEIAISAKEATNVDQLRQKIESFVLADVRSKETPALNQRQAALCKRSAAALKLVLETLENGLPQDCLATDLKTALDCLSEISGEAVSEEVINQVFASFCIGK